MNDPRKGQERENQERRTATVRRGLVAAGTVGALGAALTIGVTQTIASNRGGAEDQSTVPQQETQQETQQAHQPAVHERDDDEGSDDGQQQQQQVPNPQPPQGSGQLAVPGNGGPPQGQSSGS